MFLKAARNKFVVLASQVAATPYSASKIYLRRPSKYAIILGIENKAEKNQKPPQKRAHGYDSRGDVEGGNGMKKIDLISPNDAFHCNFHWESMRKRNTFVRRLFQIQQKQFGVNCLSIRNGK